MDGLVGVQRREVGVHLPVVLSNVEAVGVHILTGGGNRWDMRAVTPANLPEEDPRSLEFRLPPLTGVLPTDEPDQVVDPGVGDGHHRHGVQLLLSGLHGEVDVYLLGGRGADVTLEGREEAGKPERVSTQQGAEGSPFRRTLSTR